VTKHYQMFGQTLWN